MDDLITLVPEELGPIRYVALTFIGLIFLAPQIRELWEQFAGVRVGMERHRLQLERLKLRLEIDVLLRENPSLSLSEAEKLLVKPYEPSTTTQQRDRGPVRPGTGPKAHPMGRRALWQGMLGALGGLVLMGILLLLILNVNVDEDTESAAFGAVVLMPIVAVASAVMSVVLPGRAPGRSFVVGFFTPVALIILLTFFV